MAKLNQLAELGQAIWIDYIRRSFLTSGNLQTWIDRGLRGMTSNPTIFEKAIAHSQDYDAAMGELVGSGKGTKDIYFTLVMEDIRQAADLFRPVYERTRGEDGYVSIEVSPNLAHDTEQTIAEARQIWKAIDRPNLMIKIPATQEGLPAITAAIADGINVNVTLIFSLQRYGDVMAAYLQGLEQRVLKGLPVNQIHSVASFFVSRVDSKVDKRLETILKAGDQNTPLASRLLGQAAIANARLAYSQFKAVFEAEPFLSLRAKGANIQRPLWASTSTKNPAYSDILYVQELIGPHTVNTVPEETLELFLDHGEPRLTLDGKLEESQFVLQSLASLGIQMDEVTRELEVEGVASFIKSFDSLIESIEQKRRQFQESRLA